MKPIQFIKNNYGKLIVGLLILVTVIVLFFKEDPKQQIMREAFIYGYPLVTMDMTRRQQTNVDSVDASHAPMGQIIKMRNYPAVDNHTAAAPNAETMYTMAWFDLSNGPWVFTIPDMGNRFYIIPMLSSFNEVFFVAGTRATGSKAQHYVLTGPGWTGQIPDSLDQVKSPTALVWILGRVYCKGTPEDYAAVHALQDKYTAVPLISYGKAHTSPAAQVDHSFDMKTSVRDQVNHMPLADYFKYMARLLKTNPAKPEDSSIIARMAEIGIVPGQELDRSKLPEIGEKLDPKLALLEMVEVMKKKNKVNGWLYWTSDAGTYGTDYAQRAMVTLIGPGLNFPKDAIYPFTETDAEGKDLDGSSNKYLIHFDKGQLPPVIGFWSITMYGKDFFFVPNAINRYNLSQRDSLVKNPDGSIDMYVQADKPETSMMSNWLPAPKGKFILMMRLYYPKEAPPSILDGSWTPPPVKKIKI